MKRKRSIGILLAFLLLVRSLELQGLIQAYSRTNRVYGKEKECSKGSY